MGNQRKPCVSISTRERRTRAGASRLAAVKDGGRQGEQWWWPERERDVRRTGHGRSQHGVRPQATRSQGCPQEKEHLHRQGPQVHTALLQAADVLQPLQGFHLVSISARIFVRIHCVCVCVREPVDNAQRVPDRFRIFVYTSLSGGQRALVGAHEFVPPHHLPQMFSLGPVAHRNSRTVDDVQVPPGSKRCAPERREAGKQETNISRRRAARV